MPSTNPFGSSHTSEAPAEESPLYSHVSYSMAQYAMEHGALPQTFPIAIWNEQQGRYRRYWNWYQGTALDETDPNRTTENGELILIFPLQINALRNFVDKHSMIALGETDDTRNALIMPVVTHRSPLDGGELTDEMKKKAAIAQNCLREIWTQSGGRTVQIETMKLAQALGGGVIKITWQPWRKELRIPVVFEKVLPDAFLPIWDNKNYFDLQEVYEVYRIPAALARSKYGVETQNTYVIYYEHWTKPSRGKPGTVSIYIDGKPLTVVDPVTGQPKAMDKQPHPWDFVPYVYLPAMRDGGSFYGRSLVPQVEGILKEYNSRMADNGDAVRETVHRKRYIRNTNLKTVTEKKLASGVAAIDLGSTPPGGKSDPDAWTEDPPNISDAFMKFASEDLWLTMLRMADLTNVAFGEDEGSQRSALTMSFRMFPATSRATQTRSFWEDGLNWLSYMALSMIAKKAQFIGVPLKEADIRELLVNQQWHPMIIRDREQLINEIVLLLQAGAMSPQEALEKRSDVRDAKQTLDDIRDWLTFQADLAMKPPEQKGLGSKAQTIGQKTVADNATE